MRPSWFVLIVVVVLSVASLAGCGRQPQPSAPSGGTSQATTRTMVLDTVVQWASSRHSIVDTLPVTEDGCKNCHDGYMFSITGGGFQPRMSGSATASGSVSASGSVTGTGTVSGSTASTLNPLPATLPAPTDCRACHSGAGAQIADAGVVSGIPSISSAQGGLGALCMACHNGWHPAGKGQNGALEAPHLSTQTDVFFGVNYVDPTGSTTTSGTTSPHAKVEDTCVGCHMASPNNGSPNHTFKVTDFSICQASGCHKQDMTGGGMARSDYDGNGQVQTVSQEVDGLLANLKTAIQNKAGAFSSARGEVVFSNGEQPTNAEYAAAYNYFYVFNDKSKGVHNAKFVVDLLTRSIKAVGGTVGSGGSSGGSGGTGGTGGSKGTTGSTGTTGSNTTTP